MSRSVAFLHTSPAAIPPLMQFYGEQAPEFEITNLLDDGVLRSFSRLDYALAERSLREMLATARATYAAESAMITCSAVPRNVMQRLRISSEIPLIKIDDPMAELAVQHGGKLGVMVTFEPTLGPTTRLLEEAADRAGKPVELVFCVLPEAYTALLSGDTAAHDRLLLEGIDRLAGSGVRAVVLAQVSMARLLSKLADRSGPPVYSSLPSSLTALRDLLRTRPATENNR